MKKIIPEYYNPVEWVDLTNELNFEDILYHKSTDGIAKITINRPQVRNAFRPKTVMEMQEALRNARFDPKVGVVILTGYGEKAFCSGGKPGAQAGGLVYHPGAGNQYLPPCTGHHRKAHADEKLPSARTCRYR